MALRGWREGLKFVKWQSQSCKWVKFFIVGNGIDNQQGSPSRQLQARRLHERQAALSDWGTWNRRLLGLPQPWDLNLEKTESPLRSA